MEREVRVGDAEKIYILATLIENIESVRTERKGGLEQP